MLSSVMLIPNLNTLNLDVIPLDVIPGTPFRRYSFRRYSRPYDFASAVLQKRRKRCGDSIYMGGCK